MCGSFDLSTLDGTCATAGTTEEGATIHAYMKQTSYGIWEKSQLSSLKLPKLFGHTLAEDDHEAFSGPYEYPSRFLPEVFTSHFGFSLLHTSSHIQSKFHFSIVLPEHDISQAECYDI